MLASYQKGLIEIKKKGKKKFILIFLGFFVPFLLIMMLVASFVIFMGGGSASSSISISTGQNVGLSENVLRYKEPIRAEMIKQGVDEKWLPLVLAIVMQESGGDSDKTPDIFQASESMGYKSPNMIDTATSIQAGIKAFKAALDSTRNLLTREPSPTTEGDVRIILTLYNVPAFGGFLKNNYASIWSQEAAETFYTIELPKYGVGSGDSHYSDHVLRYYSFESGENIFDESFLIGGDEYFSQVMAEALKYQGNPYVWGGNSPLVGFDCSGLVQWCYGKAGISLTRTSQSQWAVDVVEISREEARAGDLVFFEGTNPAQSSMTHVGIYIGENMMFNAQTSGIKVDNLKNWAQYPTHFGRIKARR